jgi:cell division protein FtsZ
MVFVTAGMGGGTGTGAAPIVAKAARDSGILTVGVVTKPFHFEGQRRMRIAESGIIELHKCVDTLLIIPNQNLFRVANEKTTFADAFAMADQVLYSGVACITDLMVKEGLINLDFADVRTVMREMGKAMMGTGEAEGDKRAITAAEAAIANPLIDDASMKGAKGLLISITGGRDLTLYEVDEAATRIREEVDQDANIIVGATFDESLEGIIRVSVVATGIDQVAGQRPVAMAESRIAEVAQRLRSENQRIAERIERSDPVRPAAGAPLSPAASVNESIETAKAAMAAAILPQSLGEEVTLRPLPAKQPTLFIDPATSAPESHEPTAFIPPQPERMPQRAPRMPRIDELPVPAQNEIRARRGEYALPEHPEKRRLSLLERLASVGLGRREQDREDTDPNARTAPSNAPSMGERLPGRPMPRPEPRVEPVSEYAKRPSPQGLDQHGRQTAVHKAEEDQLDIPAFLRRAN